MHQNVDAATCERITCPSCGKWSDEDDLWAWDILGACGDNLFCPDCWTQFNPDTGKTHDANQCDLCSSEVDEPHEEEDAQPRLF